MQGMLLSHQSNSTRMIGLPKWRTRWPLVPLYASVKKVVCSSRGPNALIVSVGLRDTPAGLLVVGCWLLVVGLSQ